MYVYIASITLLTYCGCYLGHTCQTCTLSHHLSLGTLMVRVSHWSSEGCGFDPTWGSEIVFLKLGFVTELLVK